MTWLAKMGGVIYVFWIFIYICTFFLTSLFFVLIVRVCVLRISLSLFHRLGVLPTFFGLGMSSVFKQKYHGDVTMVPSFTPMESIGLKAVMNPTTADIRGYISGGERAAWPHVNV